MKGKKNPNLGKALKELWADPEWRAAVLAKRKAPHKRAMEDPAVRAAMSAGIKEAWQRPQYRELKLAQLRESGNLSWTKLTPEQAAAKKAKISASLKAYHANKKKGG